MSSCSLYKNIYLETRQDELPFTVDSSSGPHVEGPGRQLPSLSGAGGKREPASIHRDLPGLTEAAEQDLGEAVSCGALSGSLAPGHQSPALPQKPQL